MMLDSYARLAQRARQLMFASYLALLVLLTLGTLVTPSCEREPNSVMWLVHILPILLFLPFLWRRNLRAHAWFCFVLLFYFLTAVPVAFACTSVMTIAEVVVIVLLFIAAMVYVRWQSRAWSRDAAVRDSDIRNANDNHE